MLPGSEVPVGGDLPRESKLVAPTCGVSVLLLLLSHRVHSGVVRADTLLPGFLVFPSMNDVLLIYPGGLTGTEVSPQSQSPADQKSRYFEVKMI